MAYYFRNLVFEGGGVKGIAYVGAMKILKKKRILSKIKRVGGTSAGAINATLFALGFSIDEQEDILNNLDFNNFMDDSWGKVRDTVRLTKKFGWYKGDFFHEWISKHIKKKLGNAKATFKDLKGKGKPDLYVYGTNLSTGFGKIFSYEHNKDMSIADAVRISMSIPLFFTSVRMKTPKGLYVDGGVLNNYPIKLFDRLKYINKQKQPTMAVKRKYYNQENKKFLKKHPSSSPYIYNRETLGFRLDSKQEIAVFRHGAEPEHHKIQDFFDYIKALITTILEFQGNLHLHSDDWKRTIYIDTKGVGTTDFDLSDDKKKELKESGEKCTEKYFEWFDARMPINKPR
jgi:NTE family protein